MLNIVWIKVSLCTCNNNCWTGFICQSLDPVICAIQILSHHSSRPITRYWTLKAHCSTPYHLREGFSFSKTKLGSWSSPSDTSMCSSMMWSFVRSGGGVLPGEGASYLKTNGTLCHVNCQVILISKSITQSSLSKAWYWAQWAVRIHALWTWQNGCYDAVHQSINHQFKEGN